MTSTRRLPLIVLTASLAAGLVLFTGCAEPPPQADTLLSPRLEPSIDDGVPRSLEIPTGETSRSLAADRAHAIEIERSHREAVLTRHGLAWQVETSVDRDARLGVTIAAPGRAEGSIRAWVRLVENDEEGEADTLALHELAADGAWTRHRLDLPAVENGRLILESESDSPVAWAEVHLLGPDAPEDAEVPENGESQNEAKPPNLVMVVIDTLRADHLSTYGHERETTPNLDRLAEHAIVFEHSLSASTWTLPSTASLLTGLLPAQHGLRTIHDSLGEDLQTMAERLRAAGYRTAAITDGGFLDPRWGFQQGFERYDVTTGKAWGPKDVAPLVDEAIAWLEENEVEPFFLLVHTYEAHQPYHDPEGFAEPFFDGPVPEFRSIGPDPLLRVYAGDRDPERVPEAPVVAENVGLYDGEIRRADHHLGRLFEVLEKESDLARTAILVTSDHGEEFLEYGNVEHGLGKVFDPNVRVPLLLKLPGQAEGRRIETPTSGVDVVPTLLDLAGLPAPEGGVGRSLAGSLDARRPVLVEGLNSFPKLDENRLRLDDGDATLIHDVTRRTTSFFDRASDPELRAPIPALDEPRAADLVARLQAIFAWTDPALLATRLPAGYESVTVGPGSRLVLRGARSGLEWREADALTAESAGVTLDPARETYLLFDLAPGSGDWVVEATRPDGTTERLSIATRTDEGPLAWSAASDELPPERVAFPTYRVIDPEATEITPEATKELQALGYL